MLLASFLNKNIFLFSILTFYFIAKKFLNANPCVWVPLSVQPQVSIFREKLLIESIKLKRRKNHFKNETINSHTEQIIFFSLKGSEKYLQCLKWQNECLIFCWRSKWQKTKVIVYSWAKWILKFRSLIIFFVETISTGRIWGE